MSNLNRPNIAKHLNNYEFELLTKTHQKHHNSMGQKEKEKYKFENIIKIERNLKENCLNVHFENGEWWHYTTNYTWY